MAAMDKFEVVRAGPGAKEVVDAVLARVLPGHEARPGREGPRWQRRVQRPMNPFLDESGDVWQLALGHPGMDQVERGTVPADQEHAIHGWIPFVKIVTYPS